MSKEPYRLINIPRQRRFSLDAGRMGRGKHIVHGLLEVDVTAARQRIQAHRAATGETLSFTAFIISCLGTAIAEHPETHAYRNWRGQLQIFDDVSINSMIEVPMGGRLVPMPYIFRQANRKSYQQLHQEIRAVQSTPMESDAARFMGWFLYLPWFVRRLFYWTVTRVPHWFRQQSSPVMVTAVGMFGRGSGWAITKASNTLTVAVGSISKKPGVVGDRIEIREFLHLTISIDHDVVDGAPAARFGSRLVELIESGYGLPGGRSQDGSSDSHKSAASV